MKKTLILLNAREIEMLKTALHEGKSNIETYQEVIDLYKRLDDALQTISSIVKCPSCLRRFRKLPALSRLDNKTMICSKCGTDEALHDYFNNRDKPCVFNKLPGEDLENCIHCNTPTLDGDYCNTCRALLGKI